ncbi:hypothetical protein ES708_21014 [subsurface metagenome]
MASALAGDGKLGPHQLSHLIIDHIRDVPVEGYGCRKFQCRTVVLIVEGDYRSGGVDLRPPVQRLHFDLQEIPTTIPNFL